MTKNFADANFRPTMQHKRSGSLTPKWVNAVLFERRECQSLEDLHRAESDHQTNIKPGTLVPTPRYGAGLLL